MRCSTGTIQRGGAVGGEKFCLYPLKGQASEKNGYPKSAKNKRECCTHLSTKPTKNNKRCSPTSRAEKTGKSKKKNGVRHTHTLYRTPASFRQTLSSYPYYPRRKALVSLSKHLRVVHVSGVTVGCTHANRHKIRSSILRRGVSGVTVTVGYCTTRKPE